MKRSGFLKRSKPLRQRRHEGADIEREPKPRARQEPAPARKEAATKPCAYEKCRKPFVPTRPLQAVCGPRCADRMVRVRAAEKKAAEKAQTRERKEKLKTVTEWEDECRRIVQKIARLRDRDDGCISCHVGRNYGGQWHGSHYRSVGACSNTQFLLWNIHKSCAQCNKYKGGNREFYRPRLIAKIGLERVEWLDAQNQITKRSGPAYIEYLKRFKVVMGKRLRRMEKRIEMREGESA